MKAVYFRSTDWRDYLIPAEYITHFDSDLEVLWELEGGDDAVLYDTTCSQFDDKYEQYIVEGELKTIKFYMEEDE